MTGPVRLDRSGGVAVLTLARPARGNAIDTDMADALLETALVCESDDTIRSVLLTAEGKAFCVGGDVKSFALAGKEMPVLVRRLTASLHVAMARLARMDKPLVVAVNGAAAGAGFGLAILGDQVLAARSAKFALAYGALGLTPDAGSTWLLPRLVGLRQAQRLALAGERIDAEEAERIGLITRAVDDSALRDEAMAVAVRLARGPRRAFAATRALLFQSFSNGFETQLEQEARLIGLAAGQPEGGEGVAAFVNRRDPDFTRL